jgi:carboxymethylenebutenolidase
MTRKTAADFDPEVLKLFDQYVHGGINRRDFLSSATRYAVGGTTAAGLLSALTPSFAAPLVPPDDQRITTRYVELPSPQGNGKVRGYLASPAGAKGKLPTVLVVHENRGLNPHI